MKKTLFTRAIASIAAVPLAFTQCLTVANAVSVSDVDLADASVAAFLHTGAVFSQYVQVEG